MPAGSLRRAGAPGMGRRVRHEGRGRDAEDLRPSPAGAARLASAAGPAGAQRAGRWGLALTPTYRSLGVPLPLQLANRTHAHLSPPQF